jgi:hypothetical protein
MLREDFIIHKTRCLLNEFMTQIIATADRPRREFLCKQLGQYYFSGSLVVSELARWIRDDCSDIFYRLKRLLNHLVSPRGNWTAAAQAYKKKSVKYIEPDTPIVIDLTDLAKPRAKKMKYLALIRDGSEHKLVPGYWCMQVYVHLKQTGTS